MKKFFMTLVAAMAIVASANAQVYVGGGIGIYSEDYGDDDDVTVYKFVPEIGYNFNKDWAAGVAFGWEGASKGGTKTFSINPYARYTFVHSKYVNVFVDGGVEYAHTYNNGHDSDGFGIGFKPGVAVNLNDKLSFVTHVGFLGYQNSKNHNNDAKVNQWGLDLDGRNITFGLYYNF